MVNGGIRSGDSPDRWVKGFEPEIRMGVTLPRPQRGAVLGTVLGARYSHFSNGGHRLDWPLGPRGRGAGTRTPSPDSRTPSPANLGIESLTPNLGIESLS